MVLNSYGNPDISGKDPQENVVQFNGEDYEIGYLSGNAAAEGGNGLVFKITNNQNFDTYAVKICKFPREATNEIHKLRRLRFTREIEAFGIIGQEDAENVVAFIGIGEVVIKKKTYDFYVMEKCDSSLQTYLNKQPDLSIQQRIYLFDRILNGVSTLHKYGIYHRDLKNENILMLDGEPKICDLGLSKFRPSDAVLDIAEIGERIGPTGWFSPEATNKFLVESTSNPYKLMCDIGAKSDVFQLGKLFWYVLQGNLPLGQIAPSDLLASANRRLFKLIRQSLAHSHKRRISLSRFQSGVEELFPDFNL